MTDGARMKNVEGSACNARRRRTVVGGRVGKELAQGIDIDGTRDG